MRRHIFPNVLPATLTYGSSDAVLVIGVIAALPFLGAGVQPPTPEWGSIIYDGRSVLSEAPWVCLGPGLLIVHRYRSPAHGAGVPSPVRGDK